MGINHSLHRHHQEVEEKPPSFVTLPHHNTTTWPGIKAQMSRKIENGKQLDEALSNILKLKLNIADVQLAFFDTFDFDFLNNVPTEDGVTNTNNNNSNTTTTTTTTTTTSTTTPPEATPNSIEVKGGEQAHSNETSMKETDTTQEQQEPTKEPSKVPTQEKEMEQVKDPPKESEDKVRAREQAAAHFFTSTLPMMQRLGLEVETKFKELEAMPTLRAGGPNTRYDPMPHAFFQDPNFMRLYCQEQVEMVKFFVHYFTRMQGAENMLGNVSFSRRGLAKDMKWAKSDQVIGQVEILATGRIEESVSDLHVDFANRYIGGGVLHGGHVQEEILFAIKPECVASLIFCSRMEDNEVVFITGAERYSKYLGYGRSLKFGGNFVDTCPRDKLGRRDRQILAMDATLAFATGGWHKESIERDLNKALCGFYVDDINLKREAGEYSVATGNWGCGAFGGDPQLKFLQQIMAAAVAGRKVYYYAFSESEFSAMLTDIYEFLVANRVTVGKLYKLLLEYEWKGAEEKIFKVLKKKLIK